MIDELRRCVHLHDDTQARGSKGGAPFIGAQEARPPNLGERIQPFFLLQASGVSAEADVFERNASASD